MPTMQPSEAVAVLSGFGLLFVGLRWTIRQIVRDELATATRPIQPGYRNGGESLADVAHELRRIRTHLGIEG